VLQISAKQVLSVSVSDVPLRQGDEGYTTTILRGTMIEILDTRNRTDLN
jgi:hypothetical protein